MGPTQSTETTWFDNEQEKHAAFEQLVGGPDRSFRLMRLYTSSGNAAAGNKNTLDKRPGKLQLFRQFARRDRYTDQQIDAFLELQGDTTDAV